MTKIIFTMVLDVEQDEQGNIKLESANWVGIEPEVALTLLQQVIIEKKTQEVVNSMLRAQKESEEENSGELREECGNDGCSARGADPGDSGVATPAERQD
jgi:hypothetical protein